MRVGRVIPTAGPKPVRAVQSATASAVLNAKPAICAVQLQLRPENRTEVEAWLCEGRGLLETALHARRPADSVPKSSVVGQLSMHSKSCYQWIHMPSPDLQAAPDTVAILFTRADDLHLWRASEERRGWLARGASFAADGADSVLIDAEKITLQRDDGSLGGWLPSRDGSGTAEQSLPPPPPWKVAATVLLPMFCVQEANRAVLVPALAATDAWAALPPTVQTFAVCSWTAGTVTMVLLPHARSLVERIGFIGGRRGCPEGANLARGGGMLVACYAGVVGAGVVASWTFGM